MAKMTEKRPDGSKVVVVPADEAAELEVGGEVEARRADPEKNWPWPFGALAGQMPPVEIADIKAARREALLGKTE